MATKKKVTKKTVSKKKVTKKGIHIGTPKKATNLKKKTKKTTKVKSKVSPKPKKIIMDAPVDQYFILCNGHPVKNVKELADVLEDLRDEIFNFHVTPDKNDFAKWVHDVFRDIELAEELANIKHKTHMRLVLYKHIVKKIE